MSVRESAGRIVIVIAVLCSAAVTDVMAQLVGPVSATTFAF